MGVRELMGFAERDALAAELRSAVLVDLEALEKPHREKAGELREWGEGQKALASDAMANEVRACIVTAQAAINRMLAVNGAPAAPEPDAEPPPPKGSMRLCVECAKHRLVMGSHQCRQDSPSVVDGSTVYRPCVEERSSRAFCGPSGAHWKAKA